MSVSELAVSLGFADAAHFSRFFQKRMGVAPSAFRDGRWRG
jgi:AraC family transcriptional regulator, transcriptional activator of pobA